MQECIASFSVSGGCGRLRPAFEEDFALKREYRHTMLVDAVIVGKHQPPTRT